EAMKRAMEFDDRIPIGILYQEQKQTFHQKNIVLAGREPLVDRQSDSSDVKELMNELV
ncbi:MAG TPA: 2-oxoacid ferredoxin oxidoreductase, partial [Lachnoclostridium phytofermentans]|nr:2-oxoacid ferredoxin oxidoreductase [Lachnoclostridium phytofermentans]